MKVLTTEQIRLADAYTIRHEPVASLDLMERAATGLASCFKGHPAFPGPVRIFAGSGNNGGDGIALARLLALNGWKVFLYVTPSGKGRSPDAEANLQRLPELSDLHLVMMEEDKAFPVIDRDDLIVDALFGTGLTREPSGWVANLIDHLNASGAPILAVDIPSGLYGEDNRLNTCRHVIRASVTLTIEFPKLSFFFRENHRFVGDWRVIPIGIHPGFISELETPWNLTGIAEAKAWLRPRAKFDHKGTFGHALIIAGSKGKAGAGVLAAAACVRAGAGLTTMRIPDSANAIVQSAVPEAMTLPDPDPDQWSKCPPLQPFTAIGVGPGLGTSAVIWTALEDLLRQAQAPMVLDADALNLLALNPGSLLQVPKNSILTPHPGEFNRLFGEDPDDLSRMLRLKELAKFYGLVLVLKGAHTAVAGPDGSVWFNTSGNPGMATGGSGDVLTGILTALLAAQYDPFTAARLGVFLHGLAGDIARESTGEEALAAGDLIRSIGPAFIRIHNHSI